MKNKKFLFVFLVVALIVLAVLIVMKKSKTSSEGNVVIGGVLSLSGDNAYQGEMALNGIQLALDFINEEGGINGDSVVFVFEDSKSSGEEAGNLIRAMAAKPNVRCVITTGDNEFRAINVNVNKFKLVAMATTCSGMLDSMRSPFLYRYCYNEKYADSVLFSFLGATGRNEVLLLYPNDAWGQDINKYCSKGANDANVKIKNKITYDAKSLDQKDVAIKIMRAKPSVVCARGFGSSFYNVLRELKNLGYKGIIVGDLTVALPETISNTKGIVEGAYFVSPSFNDDPSDSLTVKYKARYKEKYGIEATMWDAFGFDACMNVVNAIAYSADSKKNLQESFYLMDKVPMLLGKNKFEKGNMDVHFMMNVYQIKNGESVLIARDGEATPSMK